MNDLVRYRLIFFGLIVGQVLFKLLFLPVGLLVLSALGLLIMQHYWLALLVLALAELCYQGGYWLLVGRWLR